MYKGPNIAQQQLDEYVRQHAMRPSRVRNMVLDKVCQLSQPFTAAQLVQVCQEDRISVGTVYNTLNLLILARILHAIQRQRGMAATEYELTANTNPKRMQVICTKCGRVTEFNDKAISRLVSERKYSNFNLHHFSLLVYGECKLCRKLKKKETEK